MRLPKFEYLEPHSLSEACGLLAQHAGEARLLAGGTDLLVAMKLRSITPPYLINLKSIPGLDAISASVSEITFGPLVSLATVASSSLVRETIPALAEAASRAASPQIRGAGTLGGNVCLDNRCTYYNQSDMWRRQWEACFKYGGDKCYVVKGGKQCYALASADTVPALMALGASLRLVSSAGERVVTLDQIFTGKGDVPNTIQPNEVVAAVVVPRPAPDSSSAFLKLARRGSIDFPLVDAAVSLRRNGDTCLDVRIALTAVGPAPLRATGAEDMLRGQKLSADLIHEAANRASKDARPISAIGTTVAYRRQMISVLVRRTIEKLVIAS